MLLPDNLLLLRVEAHSGLLRQRYKLLCRVQAALPAMWPNVLLAVLVSSVSSDAWRKLLHSHVTQRKGFVTAVLATHRTFKMIAAVVASVLLVTLLLLQQRVVGRETARKEESRPPRHGKQKPNRMSDETDRNSFLSSPDSESGPGRGRSNILATQSEGKGERGQLRKTIAARQSSLSQEKNISSSVVRGEGGPLAGLEHQTALRAPTRAKAPVEK
jgi:hypothetical protein